jgi:hypothetical protein
MLSVVIATQENERELVPTLTALVGGAVDGLLSEVIIADRASRDASAQIGEDAGCKVLISADPRGARLKAAAVAARGRWLLFLAPGVVPEATWIDESRRFINATVLEKPGRQRAAVFREASASFRPALLEALALLKASVMRAQPGHGLLISKPAYDHLGGHDPGDPEPERGLLRRIGRRRLVTLRTAARLVAEIT